MKKIYLSLVFALISSCIVCAQNSFPTTAGSFVGIAIATGYTATHSLTLGSTATGIASYNTVDQTTNYQRMVQGWSSGIYQIGTYYGTTSVAEPSIQIGMQPIAGTTTLSGGRVLTINAATTSTEGIFDLNAATGATNSIITMQGTAAASSGVQNWLAVQPTINQTSTAGYRALLISPNLEGVGSGTANYLIDAGTSSAAGGGGTYTSKFVVTSAGTVGIGTTTPSFPLSISTVASGDAMRITNTSSGNAVIEYFTSDGSQTYIGQVPGSWGGLTNSPSVYESNRTISITPVLNTPQSGINLLTNGNVLIGQISQVNSAYKLDVAGNARANEIVVNTTGADFVFGPSYKLSSLSSLERYIGHYHHLPEIAPAKQMQAEGLNVGENETKLLQKVEELTLYIIELNKQLKAQQKEINELKNKQ